VSFHAVEACRPPDFTKRGFDGNVTEEMLPADVADLWVAYTALTADQHRQFLQAAAKWQEALTHWRERSTLSFALMVVACEALKPLTRNSKIIISTTSFRLCVPKMHGMLICIAANSAAPNSSRPQLGPATMTPPSTKRGVPWDPSPRKPLSNGSAEAE
jgi:hypothetical protein